MAESIPVCRARDTPLSGPDEAKPACVPILLARSMLQDTKREVLELKELGLQELKREVLELKDLGLQELKQEVLELKELGRQELKQEVLGLKELELQKIKHELKELGEHQDMTEATLKQLVTEVAELMQAQVRSRGSAPTARRLGGWVLAGFPATAPGRLQPSSLHSTLASWLHPFHLRADPFSPSCSRTS